MAKEKTTDKFERGITPGKVAYLYGITLETLHSWIRNSSPLNKMMDDDDDYFIGLRKWSPRQLQMIFDAFGDPRDYQDIINSDKY